MKAEGNPVEKTSHQTYASPNRYGNNYANLGSIKQSTAGKYRLRYGPAVGAEPGIKLCKKDPRECQGYQGFIDSPTPYGTFVGRFVVKDEATDLDRIHGIQNQISFRAVVPEGR